MSGLLDFFLDPLLNHSYFSRALLAGSLVAVVCGVMGCFIILRRMAFLGDALSHAMLAGVTAGYLLMKIVFGVDAHAVGMVIGSLLAGLLTVAMISFVSRSPRIKEDTAIGIVYTGIFAVGGLMASFFSNLIHIDLVHFVMGQVLAVTDADLWMISIVAAVVLSAVVLCFRQLQPTCFDPVMAASIGVPVVAMNYLLTTCTSLVVVSGVTIVGVILVIGLLITPAATAYLLSDCLGRMIALASLFGVSSIVGGLYLSEWLNVASGSAIVVFGTLQFLIVFVCSPRYGLLADWLRRQRAVPQRLAEDVIDIVRRAGKRSVPISAVTDRVAARTDEIRRAVKELTRRGWLARQNEQISLTEQGVIEARRLLRAHRLWETYLERIGTPVEQLHMAANQLEHVHDEAAVDYLDDKLGHPLTDPHGAEIPEDFVHLVPGQKVRVSLLREGHSATVSALAPAAKQFGIELGTRLTAGPRREGGNVWTFKLDSGREISLDHQQADAVMVRLDE